MRRNLKFHFGLDLKRTIFFNFFSQIPKLLNNYNFISQITKHEKDSPFHWECQSFVTKLTLMGLNCSQDQTLLGTFSYLRVLWG